MVFVIITFQRFYYDGSGDRLCWLIGFVGICFTWIVSLAKQSLSAWRLSFRSHKSFSTPYYSDNNFAPTVLGVSLKLHMSVPVRRLVKRSTNESISQSSPSSLLTPSNRPSFDVVIFNSTHRNQVLRLQNWTPHQQSLFFSLTISISMKENNEAALESSNSLNSAAKLPNAALESTRHWR